MQKRVEKLIRKVIQEELQRQYTAMEENNNQVEVMNLDDDVQSHVSEAVQGLRVTGSELYELKKISDDISKDYPHESKEILNTVEPMMETLELYERFLQKLPNKLKKHA